jgi:hypothetical protein
MFAKLWQDHEQAESRADIESLEAEAVSLTTLLMI